ncbi:DNA helicase-2 / ATP-dependent DNA helicase PcrA [Pedococcus cremeus]|uniref:DNA 3'-5' helicase n=1 Tax=Pedococcus cremeus TaxID=587636 RepID=A0A1H9RWW6_9MICO|nr:DNA helicase-2 / ATP-dependent DNA helicase PcrA [Pedococcus cremeus]
MTTQTDPSTRAVAGSSSGSMEALAYSADEIAEALEMHRPTDEQRAVIEAPLAPLLVVAGAGSGKTETMASRVVWLVANGLVDPDQVLGLTFTRKAATELAERITQRLRRLQRAGLWTPADDEDDAETLGGTPTVSTYHSYAGRLVREHAPRLGYESESRLLSEAAAWQYAAEVVASYDGPMDAVTKAESTITAAVVDLAGEMAEHLLTPRDVGEYLARVDAALASLPKGASRAKDLPKETKAARDALRERAAVLPMVERYLRLKRERDAMDFADQMALAARLATRFDDIGAIERQRFRAVLLDEFQDTSEAQLELLRALFVAPGEPVPVTAVGDPNQSIYGWRGASATTLSRFPRAFREGDHDAIQLPLSTSWRNHRAILTVANHVAAPLREAARVPVAELRPSPAAGPGRVAVARLLTVEDEAAHVAEWIAGKRATSATTAAVLCRKRSQFAPVIDALESRDIPYEVVGLGGLLLTPEVEDIVSLLHVVQDPTRGDHLMRLLTGPLCRLGAADLDGLMAWARHQQRVRSGLLPAAGADGARGAGAGTPDAAAGDAAGAPGAAAGLDDETAPADPSGVREQAPDAVDQPSIVEAVDDLPRPGWRSHTGQWVSDAALARLTALQQVIRRLRSLTALPLADLVGEAERALGLDIEVLSRPGYSPAAARAHLDAFADVAAGFTASADRPNLGGFLSWLEAALKEERGLDKGYIEASPDAVQILTVHAAKGLEWDAVAVPGLVEGSFPALNYARSTHDGTDWVVAEPKDRGWCGGLSGVPYDLRGDRDGLPVWEWRSAEDWSDVEAKTSAFIRAGGEHGVVEERRLAYVAFTRARGDMLLTAPVWAGPGTPRVPSRFLTEVAEAPYLPVERQVWVDLPDPDQPDTCQNPRDAEALSVQWPATHDRAEALLRAGAAVRAAVEATAPVAQRRLGIDGQAPLPIPGEEVPILEELELLLAERARLAERRAQEVAVPRHLSTSSLVALAQDPDAFATSLRRPMPEPPALAARRGTAFHAWVEQHYARAAIVDLLDLPGSADEDPADDAALPAMKEHFLASEWAARTPVEIEIAVETVIDGMAVRGRIDAVFRRADGGFTVVDWKTGSKPTGEAARTRALQLAAYRVAFARLRGLDVEQVDAAFYYAVTGETVWPDLPDADGLAVVLRRIEG